MTGTVTPAPLPDGIWIYGCDGYLDWQGFCHSNEGFMEMRTLNVLVDNINQAGMESLFSVSALVLAIAFIFRVAIRQVLR